MGLRLNITCSKYCTKNENCIEEQLHSRTHVMVLRNGDSRAGCRNTISAVTITLAAPYSPGCTPFSPSTWRCSLGRSCSATSMLCQAIMAASLACRFRPFTYGSEHIGLIHGSWCALTTALMCPSHSRLSKYPVQLRLSIFVPPAAPNVSTSASTLNRRLTCGSQCVRFTLGSHDGHLTRGWKSLSALHRNLVH